MRFKANYPLLPQVEGRGEGEDRGGGEDVPEAEEDQGGGAGTRIHIPNMIPMIKHLFLIIIFNKIFFKIHLENFGGKR